LFAKEPAQVKPSMLAELCTALEFISNDLFEVDTTSVERPAAPVRFRQCSRRSPGPAAGRCPALSVGATLRDCVDCGGTRGTTRP
jgi:hypothetical protein